MQGIINKIFAREILDSRGNPTVEAVVVLNSGIVAKASCPSGASTGSHEAHELRDGDIGRYGGKGVIRAVENINSIIAPALIGKEASMQADIDHIMIELDGTENKSRLGANAILAVSVAVAKAAAKYNKTELYRYLGYDGKCKWPTPMLNILNGGAHASNNLDIQEFMILPHLTTLPENIRAGSEIFHLLGSILRREGYATGVGDEGGYAPNLASDEDAIKMLCRAITEGGYSIENIGIALDVAASEWYKDNQYTMPKRQKKASSSDLIQYYSDLCEKYPVLSIEDGLNEDDFDGWKRMTDALGKKIMLVGDDLFVTNPKRLSMGIKLGIGNTILIKPNQIGTLTETLKVIELARGAGYKVIISHRSGETTDSYIADIAVATGAEYIKAGAPCRGERVAKYNRLTEIYALETQYEK